MLFLRSLLSLVVMLAVAGCMNDQQPADVIARVNGKAITLEQIQARHNLRAADEGVDSVPTVEGLRSEYGTLLAERIVLTLVEEELEARGMAVTAKDVETAEQEIRADYPPGAFEQVLVEQYIDPEVWREQLAERIGMERFFREVLQPTVRVEAAEAKAYYDARRGEFVLPERRRFLVFQASEASLVDRAAAAYGEGVELNALRQRFTEVAIHEMVMALNRMPGTWRTAMAGLPEGAPSPAMTEGESFQAFVVIENLPERMVEPAQAYPMVERILMEEKVQAAFDAWLKTALDRATIDVSSELARTMEHGASQ